MAEFPLLDRLETVASPAQLEAGVPAGLRLLEDIKSALLPVKDNAEAVGWLKELERVQLLAERQRIIVGVMGGTGAGKSSIINALLDEEKLVPTNSMRACTSVVTEIAFNHSDDPNEAYRAEIEFITPEDWKDELNILFSDLVDPEGHITLSDCQLEGSEAKIALTKIRSIYPALEPRELIKLVKAGDVATLAEAPEVVELLGTTRSFYAATSKSFAGLLKPFVDSKDKGRSRIKDESPGLELWPLIKVVRIYTKHPVLESGVVIADLPGVHDSNAARSAVAAKYQELCASIWVVAPITRAIDDKSAQDLMGSSFRRRLQLDGKIANITMVCSKTDQLSITEVMAQMEDDDSRKKLDEDITALESALEDGEDDLAELKQLAAESKDSYHFYEESVESLETAINCAKSNDAVEVLYTAPLRPGAHASPGPVKKEPEDERFPTLEKMALAEANDMLEALKGKMRQYQNEKREYKRKLRSRQQDNVHVNVRLKKLNGQYNRLAVRFRNRASRPAIQEQFANGIKEMDREAEDEERANRPVRDYGVLSQSLPVFCVSSKAYLKLTGKLVKDDAVPGFQHIDDTEIPQLRQHASLITTELRAEMYRKFFGGIVRLLRSLMLQMIMSEKPFPLAEELQETEKSYLERAITDLKQHLEKARKSTIQRCQEQLELQLFNSWNDRALTAAREAVGVVSKWSAGRGTGGLAWSTYRAACIRLGRFRNKTGQIDFNEDLTSLLEKKLVHAWEDTFIAFIPQQLDEYGKQAADLIRGLHARMETRPTLVEQASFAIAEKFNNSYCHEVQDTIVLKNQVSNDQREINRQFLPVIKKRMTPAYHHCGMQAGTGCYQRMKEHMGFHIEREGLKMYKAATRKVNLRLEQLMTELQQKMEDDAQRIVTDIEKEYMALVTGHSLFRALTTVRTEIHDLLAGGNQRFEACLLVEAPVANVDTGVSMELDEK